MGEDKDTKKKKKGFWNSLVRTKSLAARVIRKKTPSPASANSNSKTKSDTFKGQPDPKTTRGDSKTDSRPSTKPGTPKAFSLPESPPPPKGKKSQRRDGDTPRRDGDTPRRDGDTPRRDGNGAGVNGHGATGCSAYAKANGQINGHGDPRINGHVNGHANGHVKGQLQGYGQRKTQAQQPAKPVTKAPLPQMSSRHDEVHHSRRRPRRPKPEPDRKGSQRHGQSSEETDDDDDNHGDTTPPPPRLTEWPPPGVLRDEELPIQHALELIGRGAPTFKGHKKSIPHAPEYYYALYATTSEDRGDDTDTTTPHNAMTQLMTLRPQGPGPASVPWETLEQPSCAFLYGKRPGTITLNQWTSTAAALPPTITLRDSGVMPRPMDLYRIMERLKELQAGLEDDDETLLYRILYKRILRDPDRILNPHRSLDKQITDLILVLSRPDWIDFTDPKNQVATRFIFDGGFADLPSSTSPNGAVNGTGVNGGGKGSGGKSAGEEVYRRFFHQLLLSLELELRIHSRQHGEWAKEKLLAQIPPTIRWNLALARRWRDNVRVDGFGATAGQTRLRYKLKKRQVKTLKRFAHVMKWPNPNDTLENLRQHDEDFRLDAISSDAFAFFSGLVLPGPTFPFLIMNTLIDLDPDAATDNLALLSHMYPACGFQYRNSHTYWSASCIVGKVLAPTCRSVAGWIGPARPTADLGRSQIARIRSRQPRRQRLGPEDVISMGERSDPLGPSAQVYPVSEYELVVPDEDSVAVDTVRIELLGFRPVVAVAVADKNEPLTIPRVFDATVQFAIDGMSWPLRLMYDVSFISAWPCTDGPHPLFFDYVYRVVAADQVVRVRDWGGMYYKSNKGGVSASASARSSPAPQFFPPNGVDWEESVLSDDGDDEKVLVVEAYGVPDNEVLARAWCSHWGLIAVVADIRKTCMACAIREAYAATLTVVILVDGKLNEADANEFTR